MNRLLLITWALFCAIACSSHRQTTTPSAGLTSPAPPNLLIIMTDEHNFRTLGCYRATMPEEQTLMWGRAVVKTLILIIP